MILRRPPVIKSHAPLGSIGAGGPGSGCHGPKCGRPRIHPIGWKEPTDWHPEGAVPLDVPQVPHHSLATMDQYGWKKTKKEPYGPEKTYMKQGVAHHTYHYQQTTWEHPEFGTLVIQHGPSGKFTHTDKNGALVKSGAIGKGSVKLNDYLTELHEPSFDPNVQTPPPVKDEVDEKQPLTPEQKENVLAPLQEQFPAKPLPGQKFPLPTGMAPQYKLIPVPGANPNSYMYDEQSGMFLDKNGLSYGTETIQKWAADGSVVKDYPLPAGMSPQYEGLAGVVVTYEPKQGVWIGPMGLVYNAGDVGQGGWTPYSPAAERPKESVPAPVPEGMAPKYADPDLGGYFEWDGLDQQYHHSGTGEVKTAEVMKKVHELGAVKPYYPVPQGLAKQYKYSQTGALWTWDEATGMYMGQTAMGNTLGVLGEKSIKENLASHPGALVEVQVFDPGKPPEGMEKAYKNPAGTVFTWDGHGNYKMVTQGGEDIGYTSLDEMQKSLKNSPGYLTKVEPTADLAPPAADTAVPPNGMGMAYKSNLGGFALWDATEGKYKLLNKNGGHLDFVDSPYGWTDATLLKQALDQGNQAGWTPVGDAAPPDGLKIQYTTIAGVTWNWNPVTKEYQSILEDGKSKGSSVPPNALKNSLSIMIGDPGAAKPVSAPTPPDGMSLKYKASSEGAWTWVWDAQKGLYQATSSSGGLGGIAHVNKMKEWVGKNLLHPVGDAPAPAASPIKFTLPPGMALQYKGKVTGKIYTFDEADGLYHTPTQSTGKPASQMSKLDAYEPVAASPLKPPNWPDIFVTAGFVYKWNGTQYADITGKEGAHAPFGPELIKSNKALDTFTLEDAWKYFDQHNGLKGSSYPPKGMALKYKGLVSGKIWHWVPKSKIWVTAAGDMATVSEMGKKMVNLKPLGKMPPAGFAPEYRSKAPGYSHTYLLWNPEIAAYQVNGTGDPVGATNSVLPGLKPVGAVPYPPASMPAILKNTAGGAELEWNPKKGAYVIPNAELGDTIVYPWAAIQQWNAGVFTDKDGGSGKFNAIVPFWDVPGYGQTPDPEWPKPPAMDPENDIAKLKGSEPAAPSVSAPPKPPAPKPYTPPAPAAPKPVHQQSIPGFDAVPRPVVAGQFAYVGSAKGLGGIHDKFYYKGSDGEPYLFKPAVTSSGKPADMLAQAEAAAANIQKLVRPEGWVDVQAIIVDVPGAGPTLGSMQKMVTNLRKYKDFEGRDLTTLQSWEIEGIQKEQVLDWLIGNHDAHTRQFLRTTGTQGLYGIDKANAFKYFGKDRLALDYAPNPETPIYNTVFGLVKQGKLAFSPKASLPAIRNVEKISDDQYRNMLQAYAVARFPDDVDGRVKFLNDAVARKNSIRQDFEKFYSDVLGHKFEFDAKPQGVGRVEVTPHVPDPEPDLSQGLTKLELPKVQSDASELWAKYDSQPYAKYGGISYDTKFYSGRQMDAWQNKLGYSSTPSREELIKAAEGCGVYAELAARSGVTPGQMREVVTTIESWSGCGNQGTAGEKLRDAAQQIVQGKCCASEFAKALAVEWAATQHYLKENYGDKPIALIRGVGPSVAPKLAKGAAGHESVDFKLLGAESWSKNENWTWGEVQLMADTPRENVLSCIDANPVAWNSHPHEGEYLVAWPGKWKNFEVEKIKWNNYESTVHGQAQKKKNPEPAVIDLTQDPEDTQWLLRARFRTEVPRSITVYKLTPTNRKVKRA